MVCCLLATGLAEAAGKRAKSPRPRANSVAATGTGAPTPPAPPTWSPEERERRLEVRQLVVVGVYRPVEMVGRVVSVPREVYLQPATGQGGQLRELLGQRLEVFRSVPVPAAVELPAVASAAAGAPAAPGPSAQRAATVPTPVASPAAASAPSAAPPSAGAAAAASPSGAMARLRALKKAQQQSNAASPASTAPASAAAPGSAAAEHSPSPMAVTASEPTVGQPRAVSETERTPAPEVMHPRPRPLAAAQMEVRVGQLEVVEIRGEVAVARIVSDGVGRGAALTESVPAELPAVMAGDLARFVKEPPPPEVPPPPPPPQALSKAEKARLLAEQKKTQSERWRRKNPRGKYERKTMKWKL
jgi:hypothetical protein